jgi:hypothetical protein
MKWSGVGEHSVCWVGSVRGTAGPAMHPSTQPVLLLLLLLRCPAHCRAGRDALRPAYVLAQRYLFLIQVGGMGWHSM